MLPGTGGCVAGEQHAALLHNLDQSVALPQAGTKLPVWSSMYKARAAWRRWRGNRLLTSPSRWLTRVPLSGTTKASPPEPPAAGWQRTTTRGIPRATAAHVQI